MIAILLSGLFIASHAMSADAEPTTKDIYIQDITRPAGGPKQTRSIEDIVNASYDSGMSLLEVSFNVEVGNATITVLNGMNQCIACCDCNTALENFAYLTFSAAEGEMYTIRIVGTEYEGIGYLSI